MPRTFAMRRSRVELGVEDTLPGTVVEAAAGKGQGGFEHNGIGMGFHASWAPDSSLPTGPLAVPGSQPLS
jgi:hypothetical protein